MLGLRKKQIMPAPNESLAGRAQALPLHNRHFVLGTPLTPPYPSNCSLALFGLGCFWGAERKFWQVEGVYSTAVGYAGGYTPNPLYEEVCSGLTGHNEVVRVVFDSSRVTFKQLVQLFLESHDPTQGMQQGNDVGTQYRSGIYVHDTAQRAIATRCIEQFQTALRAAGYGDITTEIIDAPDFYFAEDYHQQYLAKNPGGYCGLGGTGVRCG
jgi:peptide-methionine (S)-S-oxide reductase